MIPKYLQNQLTLGTFLLILAAIIYILADVLKR